MIKIAINGYGRIGRQVVRAIYEYNLRDQFEIVAEKDYNMPYNKLIQVAKEEANKGELPAYKGDIDVSKYDTIFIGYPMWWYTFPMII